MPNKSGAAPKAAPNQIPPIVGAIAGIYAVPTFRRYGRRCIDSGLIYYVRHHTCPNNAPLVQTGWAIILADDGDFLARKPLPGINYTKKIISVWIIVQRQGDGNSAVWYILRANQLTRH